MSDDEFDIRATTADDHQGFINLITENFVADEPLYRAYVNHRRGNYKKKDPIYLVSAAVRKLLQESLLKTNASLVAIGRVSGQFIGGIVLQATEYPNLIAAETSWPRADLRSLLHNITYHLWDIRENADLRGNFPKANKPLQLTFLTVHREHRCRGVGSALLTAGIQYAKDNSYDLVYGVFTSYVSKMIARRVALEIVYDCDLRAVVNRDGGQAFADAGEDNVVAVMAVEVEPKKVE